MKNRDSRPCRIRAVTIGSAIPFPRWHERYSAASTLALALFFFSPVFSSAFAADAPEKAADEPASCTRSGDGAFSAGSDFGRDGSGGVSVADAKQGFAGWSQRFPVRTDCTYGISGWVQTQNVSRSGARLRLSFTDAAGHPVGTAVDSPSMTASTAWKEVLIPATPPPDGAVNHASGTGSILTLGDDFGLAVDGDGKLTLKWMAGGAAQEASLGSLTAGTPVQLALAISADKLQVWRDGQAQSVLQKPWDAGAWKSAPLVLGQAAAASPGWSSELRGLAFYDRALDSTEISKVAGESPQGKPDAVERLTVKAKLKSGSIIPPPTQTVYPRSFSWFLYEVTEGSGSLTAGTSVRVGRWTQMDKHACVAASAKPGEVDELILEPFAAHAELEAEQNFDTINGDQAEWWDVSPVKLSPTNPPR